MGHLEDLSLRMQFSGYDPKFRKEVVKSGLKAYRRMEMNDKEGKIPLHRPREWKKKEREKRKRIKKEEWYQKGGYESPIFIPATPRSELKKKLQRKVNETDIKLKIVEKTGWTLKRTLQKTSISKQKKCVDESCMICETSRKRGMCRKEGVTYEIVCKKCGEKYIGETGRNGYARMKEHKNDYDNKRESSVMWRHCKDKHESQRLEFECNVKSVFGSDATLRQVTQNM